MGGSRIWVDLSALFSGLQKRSCIFIDHDKYETVKDVEMHIRLLFGIEAPFNILNDGWFLPPSESSLVLRNDDTISVVLVGCDEVPLTDKAIENVVGEPEINEASCSNTGTHNLLLTNRKEHLGLKENITVSLKKKNPFVSLSSSSSDVTREVSVKGPVQNDEMINEQSLIQPKQEYGTDTNSEIGSGERKRKRVRRRKNKSTPDTGVAPTPQESRPSRYQTNKLLQGVSHVLKVALADSKRKHIFFNEKPGIVKTHPDVETPLKASSPQTPLRAVFEEESQISSINSSSGGSSSGNQTASLFCPPFDNSSAPAEGGLSKLMSLGNQKSPAVFERKKLEIIRNNQTHLNVSKRPLKTMPEKETVIEFKVLKMSNYSPVISEPITACVIVADTTNNQIYVQIKEGLNELQPETGKFSLEEQTADTVSSPSEYMLLNWDDLIDPNFVQYC